MLGAANMAVLDGVIGQWTTFEIDGKTVVRVPLLSTHRPPHVGAEGVYKYVGYHGTEISCAIDIMRDGQLRRLEHSEGGSGLLLVRGALAPKAWRRREILTKCLNSSFAQWHGVMFEVEAHVMDHHAPLGKIGGGHERELEESKKGLVTSYSGRWTFPPEHSWVRAILFDKDRFEAQDVAQILQEKNDAQLMGC
jgi:hypothetical protein